MVFFACVNVQCEVESGFRPQWYLDLYFESF